MSERPAFGPIEIDSIEDAIDDVLVHTARRKRIPTLTVEPSDTPQPKQPKSEKLGDKGKQASGMQERVEENTGAVIGTAGRLASRVASGSEPTHRPGLRMDNHVAPKNAAKPSRRRPLSLEVPDYLARELRITAATQGVIVKHLVLRALFKDGYDIDPADMDEDGRRLR